jgi:hypothetical protein
VENSDDDYSSTGTTVLRSRSEEEGENSILEEIAEMERLEQVPFDDEKGIDYIMSDGSL